MASTLSQPRRPAQSPRPGPRHLGRRDRGSRRPVLFSGLAVLLAIIGVTTVAPAVTDAVRVPRAEIVSPTGDLPPIAAAAYVVIDGDTGEPLASYNADQPRPVASLTKLMTARLVLEAGSLEHTATVPSLQVADDESQAGLEPGDEMSRGELLAAMLVASANDAARTLAVDVAGDERRFVHMMNVEAAAAGLDATRYANPVGLDDPAQHSSATDVALLAGDLMRDPVFRQIVAAESTTIDGSALPATNDLLGAYPGADGIKTGRTDEAGWCIAASATRDGRRIVAVVLGAPTEQARDDAARALLDYGFQQTVTDLGGAGEVSDQMQAPRRRSSSPRPAPRSAHSAPRHRRGGTPQRANGPRGADSSRAGCRTRRSRPEQDWTTATTSSSRSAPPPGPCRTDVAGAVPVPRPHRGPVRPGGATRTGTRPVLRRTASARTLDARRSSRMTAEVRLLVTATLREVHGSATARHQLDYLLQVAASSYLRSWRDEFTTSAGAVSTVRRGRSALRTCSPTIRQNTVQPAR